MSPASRGTLITGMLFFYLVLGIAAGYAAVRIWKTIRCGDHSGWVSVSWRVACFFPGIAFLILTILNFLLWGSHSTGAIPISLFIVLLLLWFCISVPLTLVGGYFLPPYRGEGGTGRGFPGLQLRLLSAVDASGSQPGRRRIKGRDAGSNALLPRLPDSGRPQRRRGPPGGFRPRRRSSVQQGQQMWHCCCAPSIVRKQRVG